MIGREIDTIYQPSITSIHWLSKQTFEVKFERPAEMTFTAGQKVILGRQDLKREYTLVSSPNDSELAICVRHVAKGSFSSLLARAKPGDTFEISNPYGFFTYQSGERIAVFVATGTGIAPFVSFAKSGTQKFILLHGVFDERELYYRSLLSPSASTYIPCVSKFGRKGELTGKIFFGRVTDFLEEHLAVGNYDFYLCGRGEMVRDAMHIVDSRFPNSKVFSEMFFAAD